MVLDLEMIGYNRVGDDDDDMMVLDRALLCLTFL